MLAFNAGSSTASRWMSRNADSTSRKPEVHRDPRLHLDRLVIENVRPVAPLADGIERGANQHGMSFQHAQVLDRSLFADDGCQYDLTLDSRAASQGRIGRLYAVDQISFHHV